MTQLFDEELNRFLVVRTDIALFPAVDQEIAHAQLDHVNFVHYSQLNFRPTLVPHLAIAELVVYATVENVELLKAID